MRKYKSIFKESKQLKEQLYVSASSSNPTLDFLTGWGNISDLDGFKIFLEFIIKNDLFDSLDNVFELIEILEKEDYYEYYEQALRSWGIKSHKCTLKPDMLSDETMKYCILSGKGLSVEFGSTKNRDVIFGDIDEDSDTYNDYVTLRFDIKSGDWTIENTTINSSIKYGTDINSKYKDEEDEED